LAILTGPVGLAVLAIVKHWDKIRDAIATAINAIRGAWNSAIEWIKSTATAAKNWIVARWNDVMSFIGGLPGRISAAARGMWDGILQSFKNAINSIIRLWNGLRFPSITVGGGDPLGPFGPSLPRVTIGGWNLPNIPLLAEGGIVRKPTLLLAGEGRHDEAIVPLPRGMRGLGSGGAQVVVNVSGSVLSERDLVAVVRRELDRGGLGGVR
ncbi:MAG: hypothetical protein L0206_21795, partial [Actinobacteria bacterium]|nr:hypothetical protein [Actinomycetota bacterium]